MCFQMKIRLLTTVFLTMGKTLPLNFQSSIFIFAGLYLIWGRMGVEAAVQEQ